jgi:hypothetical protein
MCLVCCGDYRGAVAPDRLRTPLILAEMRAAKERKTLFRSAMTSAALYMVRMGAYNALRGA